MHFHLERFRSAGKKYRLISEAYLEIKQIVFATEFVENRMEALDVKKMEVMYFRRPFPKADESRVVECTFDINFVSTSVSCINLTS